MAQSVKLNDEIMALVRRESELQSRSIAGQVTHWLRIGRAVEQSANFDHARLRSVLEGRASTAILGREEKDIWLDTFAERVSRPGKEAEAFFEERRRRGLGVGLDSKGEIVTADSDS